MTGNQDDMQDLYRQLILDHAKSPRNFGRLEDATHSAEGINPLCGDKLRLYLHVDADNRISKAGFEGTGCAISVASASLLTEAVSDLTVTDADTCFELVTNRLTHKTSDAARYDNSPEHIDLSKLKALDGVRQHPSRIKCATLAWHALHAALENSSTIATTE